MYGKCLTEFHSTNGVLQPRPLGLNRAAVGCLLISCLVSVFATPWASAQHAGELNPLSGPFSATNGDDSTGCYQADKNSDELRGEVSYRGAQEPSTPTAVYGQGVRETDWQSPEAEKRGFHLPPGFSIELFASEPQINKPLNMAWDSRGRLWVTNTVEYPYPASSETIPRDSIKILEDTTGDGRADQVITFADKLNIPMGLLPVSDGVICFSIPSIWYLKDTNGDDRVDERIELLGPFDTTRDTHGMINALRRGNDGWIYACHGFNNQSTVTAQDGSSVRLISGNTFRFRADGSRIEQFTSGQVNPFGMTQDEFGNWYTADCHSKPLTALLHGACYPSFGRPHDGLGFAPSMMDHLHGSTAISGLCYYLGLHFPQEYRHLFYSGNVMTSRINCNRLVWHGATAKAEELPDFLTSDDPWFRPVDIQLGPDGALYVADFYNKIIGHYEVPLEHPGRDRESGRIWRISYRGTGQASRDNDFKSRLRASRDDLASRDVKSRAREDLSELSPSVVNPTRQRMEIERLITDTSIDTPSLEAKLFHADGTLADLKYLDVLCRRGQLDRSLVERLENSKPDSRQCIGLFNRAAGWASELQGPISSLARQTVKEFLATPNARDPLTVRSAVHLLGQAGDWRDIPQLRGVIDSVMQTDPALTHVSRIAVRNLLDDASDPRAVFEAVFDVSNEPVPESVLSILPGVQSPAAAALLAEQVHQHYHDRIDLINLALQQLIANLTSGAVEVQQIVDLLKLIAQQPDPLPTAEQLSAVSNAYWQTTGEIPEPLRQVGSSFLEQELLPRLRAQLGDHPRLAWSDEEGRQWQLQERQLQDGRRTLLRSSHTLGEVYVGRLRSEAFTCPDEIRFWLAGHNRPPDEPEDRNNFAHLVNPLTGESLIRTFVPRNDTAQEVVWDTSDWEGTSCIVELVDGDQQGAYAWIAAGEFSIESLNGTNAANEKAALELVLRSGAFVSPEAVFECLADLPFSRAALTRLTADLARGQRDSVLEALIRQVLLLNRTELIDDSMLGRALSKAEQVELASKLCAAATVAQQRQFTARLLTSLRGFELVAKLLGDGKLSPVVMLDMEMPIPTQLDASSRSMLEQASERASALRPTVDPASVSSRVSELDWQAASSKSGKKLFEQHCATCHQLRGVGKMIGPQLDGAIKRGRHRLAEDILAPNLNVDLAFRQTILLLENETIAAGLAMDQEDGSILLTAQDGKQTMIPSDQILQRKQGTQSFMPSNFGQLLDDQQLACLLQYLVEGQ